MLRNIFFWFLFKFIKIKYYFSIDST